MLNLNPILIKIRTNYIYYYRNQKKSCSPIDAADDVIMMHLIFEEENEYLPIVLSFDLDLNFYNFKF